MAKVKKDDLVMVRDVKNCDWDFWCKGRVIGCYKDGGWDILEIEYRLDGVYHKVLSNRIGGIVKPLDDDVATVLSFGTKAIGFLKDFRI